MEMNNSVKFLCSWVPGLAFPGSSWLKKHHPVSHSGYGAVTFPLQCLHATKQNASPHACCWALIVCGCFTSGKGLIAWVWKMCMANSSIPQGLYLSLGQHLRWQPLKSFHLTIWPETNFNDRMKINDLIHLNFWSQQFKTGKTIMLSHFW